MECAVVIVENGCNQIIDQVAAEEKYSPEVVKTALQIIDRQRELVAV